MTRVVVVDPVLREVREMDLDMGEALEGVRRVIGGYAEFIPLATIFPRHAMFVDEDARMKLSKQTRMWRLPGTVPFLGPAVIFGTTGTKEVDATISAEVVEEAVQWLTDNSEAVGGV